MSKMKLSVIIPVYNVEAYLSKCLDSVLDTPEGDWELIVVNDGSTDGSPEILTGYERRFPGRVRRIDTPNGGLGHARNVGLDAAQGDFLLFLDSDDFLAPGALPELLGAIDGSFDMLIFDLKRVREDGSESGVMACPAPEGDYTLEKRPELLFDPPNACGKLFRRALFDEIRFPDRLWFEDLHTVPKLYPAAERIRIVHKAWYCYLQRSGSITNSASVERNLEMITAVDSVLDWYRQAGLYDRYAPELEYMAFYNQFLTSSTRVNLIDRGSHVQDALLDDFLEKFPDFRQNRYVAAIPAKYRLLTKLILSRRRVELNLVMRANNMLRH